MTKAGASSPDTSEQAGSDASAVSQAMKAAERAVIGALTQQAKTIEGAHQKAALAAQAIADARTTPQS